MEALTTFPTALKAGDPDDGDLGRQLRGLAISATVAIREIPHGYLVPSQSVEGSDYFVSVEGELFCACPDFEKRREPCKHVYSVWCFAQREASKIQLSFPDVPQPAIEVAPEKKKAHSGLAHLQRGADERG